jgi:hypothetical protein
MQIADDVLAEIAARFAPAEADRVKAELEAATLPFLDRPSVDRDRVHLAVLLCADGDYAKFQSALRLAAQDWRDVLVAAGLANADWPRVLAAAGWRVPRGAPDR